MSEFYINLNTGFTEMESEDNRLKNLFSGSSRTWKGLTLASSLIALSSIVVAFTLITWSAPVSLVVTSIDLKVYWEANCTTPVTTIDYGNIETDGTYYYKVMYIKNEGLGPVLLCWNSTLGFVTDQLTDTWQCESGYGGWGDLNGSLSLGSGSVRETRYRVWVPGNVDPGSYSWTLYLGAEQ